MKQQEAFDVFMMVGLSEALRNKMSPDKAMYFGIATVSSFLQIHHEATFESVMEYMQHFNEPLE